MLRRALSLLVLACVTALGVLPRANPRAQGSETYDQKMFAAEMRWRAIGPFRGGRAKSITGVPGQPNVFYTAFVNGGVWKTNDYGRSWKPIFDDQPTGSIGAVAVAPSAPNIVYVGSGEGIARPDLSTGDGIYKSTDAGKTWTHLGLRDGQQIPYIIVDPRDANRLFVAVLGHPYGPNEERGVFRSTDGGRSFQKVFYKDENTGASDLEFDPRNPDIVYACLWETRQGPWENGAWNGVNGGIYKSTDGGTTWKPLTKGLPEENGASGVVQADIAIAPSNPNRIYASVASRTAVGIYRSDDAGESWTRITTDARPAGRIGGGDLPVPVVHPTNPDIVVMASTVTWKSTDGGRTWTGIRGAPGGDDYQRAWINPTTPDIMAIASDQGTIVTVNGGETWSSWYNQPTAQMYHVAADNAFPYRVCGGQQESGSACVSSRGNDGEITFREWHPVGVDEYGYAAPDPANPDIIYGGRTPIRYDRRTAQVQNIAPKPGGRGGVRTLRTAPVLFSPVDPHVLYYAANTLWKTSTGGRRWQEISPDLSRKTFEIPATVGKFRSDPTAQPTQRGVIYTVAPSYVDINRIWAGTDDGLIHVTTDGGATWKDVTPPELKPFAKVSLIDAGHFDVPTAYAAINTLRLDDLRPHIYRTHDGGTTWTHITTGIPDGATINVVREDPKRKGLLYAGSEREVYVSFDDGERWQSLRLNMPATSVRDVIVKGDDLIAGTHGRGIWILDDITPLRSATASAERSDAVLFKPTVAYRVRWNNNTDTPIPPDEATGLNPPEGAIINYSLKSAASGPVTLEVFSGSANSSGERSASLSGERTTLVRRYSSTDRPESPDNATAPVPLYWYRPPHALSTAAGMHRFTWDLHYQPLAGGGGRGGLPIAAVPFNTVPASNAPWVAPGTYTVKFTVDGKSYTQPLIVKMDPRVKTPALGLAQQFTLSKQMYDGVLAAQKALEEIRALRTKVSDRSARLSAERAGSPERLALQTLDQKLATLEGTNGGGRGGGGGRGAAPEGPDTFSSIGGGLTQLMTLLQGADVTPTTQLVSAVNARGRALANLMAQWRVLRAEGRKLNLVVE
ncbi:MAG: glycoside hydrolase [Acidobacteria bacterium]|nr:glycoside hydrolase [Acidobacteriota bacterium]